MRKLLFLKLRQKDLYFMQISYVTPYWLAQCSISSFEASNPISLHTHPARCLRSVSSSTVNSECILAVSSSCIFMIPHHPFLQYRTMLVLLREFVPRDLTRVSPWPFLSSREGLVCVSRNMLKNHHCVLTPHQSDGL